MYLDDQLICFFLVVFFSSRILKKHNESGKNLRGPKILSILRGPNPRCTADVRVDIFVLIAERTRIFSAELEPKILLQGSNFC